jgi:hypothetical protein
MFYYIYKLLQPITTKTYLLFLALFGSISLHGQIDSTNVAVYFEDDGPKSGDNQVKIDVLTIVFGELPVSYERAITDNFSLEIGVGILLPYHVPEFVSGVEKFETVDGGSTFRIEAKYLEDYNSRIKRFYSLRFRQRNFKLPTEDLKARDLSFLSGIQMMVGKGIVLDYYVGLGYQFGDGDQAEEESFGETLDQRIFIPFGAKIGIIF